MRSRLDSRALTLFVAVARHLSFRRAAQELHLSQPPLSRAIRELEERLGVRLFERDTQAVALTEAGRALLPRAERILALLAQAEAALVEQARPTRLRIGLTTAVEMSSFEDLLGRLARERPGVALETVADTSPRLVRAVDAGRLDAAFIALPTETRGLPTSRVGSQAMVVALAAKHALARRRTIALADLHGQALLRFERARQPAFFDHLQAAFKAAGVVVDAIPEPADHPRLLSEVASGRALALLPASFKTMRRAGVVYRPLAEGARIAIGLGLVTCPREAGLTEALGK
jgi:DNA-binding transcriptional LysR family regulator